MPTAVAGLTLASLFAANGWLGKYLVPLGIKGAFTPLGVVIEPGRDSLDDGEDA